MAEGEGEMCDESAAPGPLQGWGGGVSGAATAPQKRLQVADFFLRGLQTLDLNVGSSINPIWI